MIPYRGSRVSIKTLSSRRSKGSEDQVYLGPRGQPENAIGTRLR